MTDEVLWKRRIGSAVRWVPQRSSRKVVLLYHAVGSGPWALPKHQFQDQMEWLSGAARVISLNELLRSEATRGIEVALTFDDGYSSVHDGAFPVLKALILPATVYLNTGWIGVRNARPSEPEQGHYPGETFMRWSDVDVLAHAGWTLGSHGVDHLDLTQVSTAVCKEQLVRSREEIRMRLNVNCTHFAYTWGRSNQRLQRLVSESGYQFAAGAFHGPLRPGFKRMAFPRINVRANYSLGDFKAIVRGDWDYLGWIQRAKAWRS